jgi:hypothetical protein
VKDKLTRINKPNNLKDIIKNIIRINNRFYKRFLEKKGSYNFGKKQGNGKKKEKNLIELDAIYRKL